MDNSLKKLSENELQLKIDEWGSYKYKVDNYVYITRMIELCEALTEKLKGRLNEE